MKRILISTGVLMLCLGARFISLPGVQPTSHDGETLPMYSIMALGVMPFVSGFMVVEWAALLVPGWRSLRMGDPRGRAKLNRAAVLVGLILALGQSLVLVTGLPGMGVIYPLEPAQKLVAVLTLMGATAAQLTLARAVDRGGVGNGFSILILGQMLPLTVKPLWRALHPGPSFQVSSWALPLGILSIAIMAGSALWMFRTRPNSADEGTPHPSWISRPACGISPYTEVMNAFRIAAVVWYWSTGQTVNLTMDSPLMLRLGIAVGAALLFAWLFNPPARIAEAWQRLAPNSPGGIPPLSMAFRECAAFIAVLTLVDFWGVRHLGSVAADVMAVLPVTAILYDLVREWRAREQEPGLVPVWDVHQTYVVPPLLLCLKNEDIRAFPQGLHYRSLMQFFGPYAPIRILVPAHQAGLAEATLRDRLLKATVHA